MTSGKCGEMCSFTWLGSKQRAVVGLIAKGLVHGIVLRHSTVRVASMMRSLACCRSHLSLCSCEGTSKNVSQLEVMHRSIYLIQFAVSAVAHPWGTHVAQVYPWGFFDSVQPTLCWIYRTCGTWSHCVGCGRGTHSCADQLGIIPGMCFYLLLKLASTYLVVIHFSEVSMIINYQTSDEAKYLLTRVTSAWFEAESCSPFTD